jgi:hypothetical protein
VEVSDPVRSNHDQTRRACHSNYSKSLTAECPRTHCYLQQVVKIIEPDLHSTSSGQNLPIFCTGAVYITLMLVDLYILCLTLVSTAAAKEIENLTDSRQCIITKAPDPLSPRNNRDLYLWGP